MFLLSSYLRCCDILFICLNRCHLERKDRSESEPTPTSKKTAKKVVASSEGDGPTVKGGPSAQLMKEYKAHRSGDLASLDERIASQLSPSASQSEPIVADAEASVEPIIEKVLESPKVVEVEQAVETAKVDEAGGLEVAVVVPPQGGEKSSAQAARPATTPIPGRKRLFKVVPPPTRASALLQKTVKYIPSSTGK